MRILWPVAAALLLTSAPAGAQQPTFSDSLLDRSVGRWVLSGTIAGSPTTHDITAEWVLGHQYVRIHEVSRETDAAGRPAYEANVYVGWDPQAEQYVCVWLDTYGGISTQSIGRATRDGDAIPFVFAERDGSGTFHTTFAYDRAADTWTWRMDAVEQGTVQPFARVTLTRR